MSKLIQKIDDEIGFLGGRELRVNSDSFKLLFALRAFKAFVEDAMEDLDEESFSEYEQNALAVWEDE